MGGVRISRFDENAEVLRDLASKGVDLARPRSIDFAHVFPDRPSAQAFAGVLEREGSKAVVEGVDREANPWDVIVSKIMVPTCGNLTETEEHLDALAQGHGGRSDGWGFLET